MIIARFFMNMNPPTKTHQQHRICISKNGKPVIYNDAALKEARNKLKCGLFQYRPTAPASGAVRLGVDWHFPISGKHADGEPKTSKPDLDNLQKMLKDVMTELGFWTDDALVSEEHTSKRWSSTPGILVHVEEIGK